MARSCVKDLLGSIGAEFRRLEVLHEAATTRSSELETENAQLRSQLAALSSQDASRFAMDDGAKLRSAGARAWAHHEPTAPWLTEVASVSSSASARSARSSASARSARPAPNADPPTMQMQDGSPRGEPWQQAQSKQQKGNCWIPQGVVSLARPTGVTSRGSSSLSSSLSRHTCIAPLRKHSLVGGLEQLSEDSESSRKYKGAIGQFAKSDAEGQETSCAASCKVPRTLRGIVTCTAFDVIFSLLILCQVLIMAVETQYLGTVIAHSVQFPVSTHAAADTWHGADDVFRLLGYIFGILFTLEVCLKVAALRSDFVKSGWNVFDGMAVGMWVFEEAARGLNLDLPAFLRIARLMRILRLSRMVRMIQAFDSLQVMLGSIQASVYALLWSSLLLLLIQMMVALVLNSMLTDFIGNDTTPVDKRRAVYEYFGSFSRSMISLFELTLANWPTICWTLVNNVNEWYGLGIILYKLVVGFAMTTVISGVFLHETFKVASSDDELMLVEKTRANKSHIRKMEWLFKEADTSNDGFIDREEFKRVLNIPRVKTWLSAMELEVNDTDLLFEFLDDGDEQITVGELINGVARLKGSARNIDVIALMRDIHISQGLLQAIHKQLDISHPPQAE